VILDGVAPILVTGVGPIAVRRPRVRVSLRRFGQRVISHVQEGSKCLIEPRVNIHNLLPHDLVPTEVFSRSLIDVI
jgi:hypothetical protein